ncbi:hypothetical protein P9112_012162 [Eukaryota sp. TZLM1-RC]
MMVSEIDISIYLQKWLDSKRRRDLLVSRAFLSVLDHKADHFIISNTLKHCFSMWQLHIVSLRFYRYTVFERTLSRWKLLHDIRLEAYCNYHKALQLRAMTILNDALTGIHVDRTCSSDTEHLSTQLAVLRLFFRWKALIKPKYIINI